jgi:hypothetical protein
MQTASVRCIKSAPAMADSTSRDLARPRAIDTLRAGLYPNLRVLPFHPRYHMLLHVYAVVWVGSSVDFFVFLPICHTNATMCRQS